MAFAWIHLISLFDESIPSLMCCAFGAQLHTHVTGEIHQDPVSCGSCGSSVRFCTSPNHSLEILSITADKCNLCQDVLHTETHTVPAAKHLSPSSSATSVLKSVRSRSLTTPDWLQ